jgi:hypothetical protein
MPYLRCTQKLLKELTPSPEGLIVENECLGDWHANLLVFQRKKCVLFTNTKTLFSFLVVGLKKPDFKRLDEIFRQELFKLMVQEEIPQELFEKVLAENETIAYSKTNNRSVLGTMNDMAFMIVNFIEHDGGINMLDRGYLNHQLNKIPQSNIEHTYAIEQLRFVLENPIHVDQNDYDPKQLKALQKIPGVGKSIAKDLIDIEIKAVDDLNGKNPDELYAKLCLHKGQEIDRCMLYVFRCAVYFAEKDIHNPKKLKWWYWKDK